MQKNKLKNPFKSANHKHKKCLQTALAAAKKHCDAFGLRLTPIRYRVLELVWQNHAPVKAYNILDQLKLAKSSAPPTVYRALDFLKEEGLVHKIESLNAYIGCDNPQEGHKSQFFICDDCGTVAEIADPDIRYLLRKKAHQFGFKIKDEMVEIKGHCQECRGSAE